MNGRNSLKGVVAIGASAGGVEAIVKAVGGLSPDLPYAYLVVLHVPAGAPSVLAQILARSSGLPTRSPNDGDPLRPGAIHVCVPDRHLLVDDHRTRQTRGPTENGHRPAINALFRSVAVTFGPRAIGVLLSGVLDDGVLGLAAIRSRGGTTICQSPEDALFPGMPTEALRAKVVDHQVTASDLGGLLSQLAENDIPEHVMQRDMKMELENQIAMARPFATDIDGEDLGPPSGYTCPDCNGSLAEVSYGNFRCRVGHAWTADSLLKARDTELEGALWVAVRSLQEKAKLARRLAQRAERGMLFERYSAVADEAERAVAVLGDRLSSAHPAQLDE